MLNELRPQLQATEELLSDETEFRDIHPLTPPSSSYRNRRREQQPWDASSHQSLSLSVGGNDAIGENLSTMTIDSNTMAVAADTTNGNQTQDGQNLARNGEEEFEETNPLAIVAAPDSNPVPSPRRTPLSEHMVSAGGGVADVPVHIVRKEEVESKIIAWQTAEIAKVNNRFKREDVMINGVESEQVEKANAWLNKMERKLEEQRAKAVEKMQNEVAKAHRKAEEKRASAEARRGVKVAKVLELCNLMRAVGRAPSKRSFF